MRYQMHQRQRQVLPVQAFLPNCHCRLLVYLLVAIKSSNLRAAVAGYTQPIPNSANCSSSAKITPSSTSVSIAIPAIESPSHSSAQTLGMASRRPQPSPLLMLDAEDEDKYQKRTCFHLLDLLNLCGSYAYFVNQA